MEEKNNIWIFAFIFLILGLLLGFMVSGKVNPNVNVNVAVPTTGNAIINPLPPPMQIESATSLLLVDVAPLFIETPILEIQSNYGNFDMLCTNQPMTTGEQRRTYVHMVLEQNQVESVGTTKLVEITPDVTLEVLKGKLTEAGATVSLKSITAPGETPIICFGVQGSMAESTREVVRASLERTVG